MRILRQLRGPCEQKPSLNGKVRLRDVLFSFFSGRSFAERVGLLCLAAVIFGTSAQSLSGLGLLFCPSAVAGERVRMPKAVHDCARSLRTNENRSLESIREPN